MPASGPGRFVPQEEVAPEDQPPHMRAGQKSRRLLPHLAGGKGWIKNDRHDRVIGFHRIPASAAKCSEDGKRGPEQPVADRCSELGGQLPRQITSGQSCGRQNTAWAQRSGQAGQDFWKRCVMQGADGHDGVILCAGQRVLQQISEDACDIGRCHPLGLFDHGRGAVKGVYPFRSLGQFHGEGSGATAHVEYSITWMWQVPQEQPVVIGVVIPVQRVHALRLWWTACPVRARSGGKSRATTVTREQEPAPSTWADAGHSPCSLSLPS